MVTGLIIWGALFNPVVIPFVTPALPLDAYGYIAVGLGALALVFWEV